MNVFLDFEASSLADESYPIEVAWIFENGADETHLIRPAPAWTDWDAKAERMHRLSRAELEAQGEAHQAVAERMVEALSGHDLFASAPSWDGKWMSLLLRTAGFPRHALRLLDTRVAQERAVTGILSGALSPGGLQAKTAHILKTVERARASQTVQHRALGDARRELWAWDRSRDLARDAASRLKSLKDSRRRKA